MDVKVFFVSPRVEDRYPSLIVWADDAKAALEAGTRFIDKLNPENALSQFVSKNFQRFEDKRGMGSPAALEMLETAYALHYDFEGKRYSLTKNNPVLVKEAKVLEQKVAEKAEYQNQPLKKKIFGRLFDYTA